MHVHPESLIERGEGEDLEFINPDVIIFGGTFDIFNKHTDRVKMANIAQIINVLQSVILTKDDKLVLTPTYHAFNLYKNHQDANYIPLEIKNIPYTLNGETIDALSCSASEKNGVISITISNPYFYFTFNYFF